MASISLTITGDTVTGVSLTSIVRLDTMASVAGTPAAMVLADGAWTYSFDDPALGLTYRYQYTITWSDSTATDGTGTAAGDASATATGLYIDQAYIEAVRGSRNVAVWSRQSDDADTADADAIQRCIDDAEAQVHAELSRVYTVPLSPLSEADTRLVRQIAEPLASSLLYWARGSENADPAAGSLEKDKAAALAMLRRMRSGELKIAAAAATRQAKPISIATASRAIGEQARPVADSLSPELWRRQ